MSIGATGDNQIILLVAAIASIIVVPLVLWVLMLVTSLIHRFLHIDLSFLWRLGFLVGIPAALLGASLAVDSVGQPRLAQVIEKTEPVRVDASDGTWSQGLRLAVRYDLTGQPLPPFKEYITAVMDVQQPGGTQEIATVSPLAEDFDRLHPGDSLEVRTLRVADFVSLVRPADQSTWTVFPWPWIGVGLAVAAAVVVAYGLRRTPLGYAALVGLALVARALPPVYGYRLWRERDDLSGATAQAVGQVERVTRMTDIDLGRGRGRRYSHYDLTQPFDIVQLTYTPAGYRDPVTVVDAVDVDPHGDGGLAQGRTVTVAYAPAAPRDARIVGQTRTHHWRTPFQVYSENALLLLIFAGGAVALSLGGRVLRRAWSRAG